MALVGAAVVIFSTPSHAVERAAKNAYRVEMSIVRGGEEVASPKFTVLPGEPAQISLIDEKSKDQNFRFQITATPAGTLDTGEPIVNVALVVLEQMEGAWVILGESSLKLVDGQPATLDLEGGAGPFGLSIATTSRYDARAENFERQGCPALTAQILPSPSNVGNSPSAVNCCWIACSDGSGHTMKCCNAIECCACGVCCSPPRGA